MKEDISEFTCAKFLRKGTRTEVFARFSTVAGFRGSTDLARDVRGFSVKFYTEEGNYDLVGNNIPVFFVQDAVNFPDLVHAVKPEQAAFDPGRLVPGIDVTDDPLLQGRVFSYMDTQNYRLGGNFNEIPVNRPVNGKHNNQKDGRSRMDIPKGSVSYFPNSQAAGCPYHAMMNGEKGFESHAQKVDARKVRQRSVSFADHFTQARLFFRSQSEPGRQHIVDAYSFELSKVGNPDIRRRELAVLNQVDAGLARKVGTTLTWNPLRNSTR